jgi:uncharacterized membrane-anchored protein
MSDVSTATPCEIAWIGRIVEAFKRRERLVLVLGALLQIAVLAGVVVMRSLPLLTGDTVLLRVVPVDPRDMFRGDYVTLGYDISRLTPDRIKGLPKTSASLAGQTVYVMLVPEADGAHFQGGAASVDRPSSGKYIRGTIDRWNRISFGIESYYVQEGAGHDYEAAVRQGHLSAEVAISPDGQAALRGLRIEPTPGQPGP